MMDKEKCTVLINSCDSYSDLWEPFFKLFKKYWNNCPFEIVLNTETKSFVDDELVVRVVNYPDCKSSAYGKRIKNCLKSIKTPYVILLLDDFFLREPVNEDLIEKTIKYLDDNPDVTCFNFDVAFDRYDEDDGRFDEYLKRSRFGEYRYNMQAGIWRTQDLYDAWKPNESPWDWELYGNVRSWNDDRKIYILKPEIKTPIEYGYYPDVWGVYRGKWVLEDVQQLFEENNICIDYELRGVYKENNEPRPNQYVVLPRLYSYGMIRFIHYVIWYIKRKILKISAKKHIFQSYSEDLNNCYYEGSSRR